MKILYAITELHEGGAENALCQVAKNLRDGGHQVRVVSIQGADGAVADRLRAAQIPIDALGIDGPADMARIRRLSPIIDDFAPDVFHSWLFHANFLSRLVIPKDIPLICGLRVAEPRASHVWCDTLTKHRVAKYVAVSGDVVRFAKQKLKVKDHDLVRIGNGVDFECYKRSREAARTYTGIRGITIARIAEQKGLDILLTALSNLPESIDWSWRFIGDFSEKSYHRDLRKLASGFGIDRNIVWRGQVARSGLPDEFATANLFALSSRWEGQPNAVLEAMAAGVPVIASATSGIDELCGQSADTLTLIRENTTDAWSSAIANLWQDKARLERQAAAAIVLAKARTWESISRQYLDLYNDVIDSGNSGLRHE